MRVSVLSKKIDKETQEYCLKSGECKSPRENGLVGNGFATGSPSVWWLSVWSDYKRWSRLGKMSKRLPSDALFVLQEIWSLNSTVYSQHWFFVHPECPRKAFEGSTLWQAKFMRLWVTHTEDPFVKTKRHSLILKGIFEKSCAVYSHTFPCILGVIYFSVRDVEHFV